MADFAYMPTVVRWASPGADTSSPGASRSQFQQAVLQADASTIERVIADYLSKLLEQAKAVEHDTGAAKRNDVLAALAQDLLDEQDKLRERVGAAAGAVRGQQALLAQETLRRLTVEVIARASALQMKASVPAGPSATGPLQPVADFLVSTIGRLVLLVVAVNQVAEKKGDAHAFAALLAEKAFQTGQTLRGATAPFGFDLVPWKELPEVRNKRLGEAAQLLWGSLDEDRRREVEKAWKQRTSIPSP